MTRIRLERAGAGAWTLAQPAEKLLLRDGLPGAYAFDRAADALTRAVANGTKRAALLPLVFATSWYVNNQVASPVFRKWLTSPLLEVWTELAMFLDEGTSTWIDLDDEERATITAGIRALAIDGHGAGAVSKPLALLAPDAVPLMPDAAIAFALGLVPMPNKADAQTASIDTFAPMMSWFADAVASASDRLSAIADEHATATGLRLSPAQVLDRLLWFDSIGLRHFRTKAGAWRWVRDGDHESTIHLPLVPSGSGLPAPATSAAAPIDLSRSDLPDEWRAAARAQLQ